jgi:hypothetical protein
MFEIVQVHITNKMYAEVVIRTKVGEHKVFAGNIAGVSNPDAYYPPAENQGSAEQQPNNNERDEICPQCNKYALVISGNSKLCTKCGYVSVIGPTSPVA